jgi:hypothetical protein
MKPSAQKIASIWQFKTAKNLPADVERYVQEGKDSGMDEGQAWAIAWSRFCKYKNPGSDHCKKDPSEYFSGRKASWGKCPPEITTRRLKDFERSIEPVVRDCRRALLDAGYKITGEETSLDGYASEGVYLYYFELRLPGKNALCLKFEGETEEVSVTSTEQMDVDDFRDRGESVSCPPSDYIYAAAYNPDTGREYPLKGRISPAFIAAAMKLGLS